MTSRSVSVASGVLGMHGRKVMRGIPHAIPPLLIPLFFYAAFAGALGGIGKTKGFSYYDYTAFQFIFVLYLCSAFCGVFTALDIGGYYEQGMGRRLMLATPRRMAIVAGFLASALIRAVVFMAAVWAIALATGLDVRGGALDIVGLLALGLLLTVATTLYGTGIGLRFQSKRAGGLVILPVYMAVFLTPVFTPRDQLTGWLKAVADVNPLTPVLESGRGFLAGEPVSVGLAFGVLGGLIVLTSFFAYTGMKKAEQKV